MVKVSQDNRLAVMFIMTARLLRDGRELEQIHFVADDGPCFSHFSLVSSKIKCAAEQLAERIASSQALSQLHEAPKPAPEQVAAAPAAKVHLSGKLAVLDLRNLSKDLNADSARYFTDLVRTATLQHAPGVEVMTRENLLVLLQATGKDLASCEGECEVDTGRRIGADAIVSGEIQKIGTRYKMTLRLHETHEGRLVSAAVASGTTIDQLDDEATKATSQLFEAVR